MDIFFANFLCMEFFGIWLIIWLVYNALVAKRFLPQENEITKLSIMREQGVGSPESNCLSAVSLQFFVNYSRN